MADEQDKKNIELLRQRRIEIDKVLDDCEQAQKCVDILCKLKSKSASYKIKVKVEVPSDSKNHDIVFEWKCLDVIETFLPQADDALERCNKKIVDTLMK